MNADRFMWVCMESESGRDTFVRNPMRSERGLVLDFDRENLTVRTSSGTKRIWNYTECEEFPVDHSRYRYCACPPEG